MDCQFAAAAADFRRDFQSDEETALHELGTVFRTADARRNPELRGLLPSVLAAYPRQPSKVVRVLVNFVADNVENRDKVLNHPSFWAQAFSSPPEEKDDSSLLMILINQYLRSVEPEDLQRFVGDLVAKGCHTWVMQYYSQLMAEMSEVTLEEIDIQRPLEFFKELSAIMPERVDAARFMADYPLFVAMSQKGHDLDVLDDILLAYTEIMYNCTNVQDTDLYAFGDLVELLALGAPSQLPHSLNIRRNLFAASGNVSSYPAYNNTADAAANLARLGASADAYVVAACAVALGNCISSPGSQRQFLLSHPDVAPALHKILHTNFMDVIQFQAFHFFNNVLTVELARDIVSADNAVHLSRQTKIVADNFNYYKDVAQVYLKFLRKLTALGFQTEPRIDFLPYREAYEYLLPVDDAAEVQYLVLQVLCEEKSLLVADFKKELVEKVLAMETTVSAGLLLAKIKTLAMFIRCHRPEEVYELYDGDLSDYLPLLERFVNLLGTVAANPSPEGEAVANNTKFVAISIKGHVEDLAVAGHVDNGHVDNGHVEGGPGDLAVGPGSNAAALQRITDSCMRLLRTRA